MYGSFLSLMRGIVVCLSPRVLSNTSSYCPHYCLMPRYCVWSGRGTDADNGNIIPWSRNQTWPHTWDIVPLLRAALRLWDVWCVSLWMFSTDPRLCRMTLFPVYLAYTPDLNTIRQPQTQLVTVTVSIDGDIPRPCCRRIICWSLLRPSPSLHVTVTAATQSASVPSHVSQQPLSLVRRSIAALWLAGCHVLQMRTELLQMTQITAPDAWLVTRRAWPEREERGDLCRDQPVGRVGQSWSGPGASRLQPSQRRGKYLISGREISRWRMFNKEEMQTLY